METIGINQGAGGGENYPLVQPSDDIKGLIADLNLSMKRIKTTKIRIASLRNFQNISNVEKIPVVVLKDDNNNEVWDTSNSLSYEHHLWGTAYHIFYWRNHDNQLTLVIRDSYLKGIVGNIYPQRAWIDIHAISCLSPHIYSLKLVDKNGESHTIEDKKIILEAGYNIEMSANKTLGLRESCTIEINAEAGAGAGKVPISETDIVIEEEPLYLKTLNGIAPNEEGNFSIVGEDGYGIEMKESNLHSMYIRNTDIPCCDCDLLEDAKSYVSEIANEYSEIGVRAESIRTSLNDLITSWNKLKYDLLTLKVASGTLQVSSSACHRAIIRADITNKAPSSADIALTLSFSTPLVVRTESYSSVLGISEPIIYKECGNIELKDASGIAVVPISFSPNEEGVECTSYSKSWSNVPPGSSVYIELSCIKQSRANAITVQATGTLNVGNKTTPVTFWPSDAVSATSPCFEPFKEFIDITAKDFDSTLLDNYYNYIWKLRNTDFKTNRVSYVTKVG